MGTQCGVADLCPHHIGVPVTVMLTWPSCPHGRRFENSCLNNLRLCSKLVITGDCLGGTCGRSREHSRSEEEAQGPSRPEGTTGAAQLDGHVFVVFRALHGEVLSAFDIWFT